MSQNLAVFQIGTASFLVAHLLYIRSFCHDIRANSLLREDTKVRLFQSLSIVAILSLLVYNVNDLWEKTPNLLLFTAYGVALSFMAITAIMRKETKAYWRLIIGALLFGISDNTLASLKFNGVHSDPGRAFIMLTYYAAQGLIFAGTN